MGPLVSPWTAVRPRCLALAIMVLPLGAALGLRAMTCTKRPHEDALVQLARAQYAWAADHGIGCARSTEHLLPYTRLASARDEWGSPIELTCLRYITEGHSVMSWHVRSAGPDRVGENADDRVVYQTWDLGALP